MPAIERTRTTVLTLPWSPDDRAFRSRSNLPGELRRCLELQFGVALKNLDVVNNPDAVKDSEMLKRLRRYRSGDPVFQNAEVALDHWATTLLLDDAALADGWEKADKALTELSAALLRELSYSEAPILPALVDGLRRELARQVAEHTVAADGRIVAGDPLAPLHELLTDATTQLREHLDRAIGDIWRGWMVESHALSIDVRRQLKEVPQLFRLVSERLVGIGLTFDHVAQEIHAWEGRLTEHLKDFENDSTGARLDPTAFTAYCRSLSDQLQSARKTVGDASLPPRVRAAADNYFRVMAERLVVLLEAMPPADWYDDPDAVRKTRRGYLTSAAALPADHPLQILREHSDRLVTVWDGVRKAEFGELPSEWRKVLTPFFEADLSGTLARFASEIDAAKSDVLAWQIARMISDYRGALLSIDTKQADWPNEERLVRLLTALNATGDAVSRILATRHAGTVT